MAPGRWDDEEDEGAPNSPPIIARRHKFDDEEEDGDVLDSWDAAEDSEVEREKEKKATEAKAKAEAEAKANHKTKTQRVEEKIKEHQRKKEEASKIEDDDEDEDAYSKLQRLREVEQEADLHAAEDLFGDEGLGPTKRTAAKPVVLSQDASDPTKSIDLSSLPLFNPTTKAQFTKLREVLVPVLVANHKKAQYSLFLPDFTRALAKDLSSDQIKKIASSLTTLSNEKMREEKSHDKTNKKTKAAKTKVSLNASRDISYKADTMEYDDVLDDGDFM